MHPALEALVEYAVFPPDARRRVTPATSEPFRYVCHLMTISAGPGGAQQRRVGTGTLIAPNKVLTAAHHVRNAQFVSVAPGKDGASEPFGHAMASRIDVPREFASGSAVAAYDFAVLTLTRDLGAQPGLGHWRHVSTLPDRVLSAGLVSVAGYPRDQGSSHLYVAEGLLTGVRPEQLEYRIATDTGQSGGPIWLTHDGRPTLVGLHRASVAGRFNAGVRLTPRKLLMIRTWVRS
ncbi:trypsin-like serine peptidase [Actinoplanes sp. RD1]|uniref:trypsin-like serine peptidase n=1 Tax=Actinoplanes sp. RD1 TaxID=3064538 RepID=UPI0027414ED6|nr:trypsin-like peptidase domain-containing protein [Actinoplanes sp. RD1]